MEEQETKELTKEQKFLETWTPDYVIEGEGEFYSKGKVSIIMLESNQQAFSEINTLNIQLNKFINWSELWDKEVCIQTSIDVLEDDNKNPETIKVLKQFQTDSDIQITPSECLIDKNYLVFVFSETGGQNESDNQGWGRHYTLVLDSDFLITAAEYHQG